MEQRRQDLLKEALELSEEKRQLEMTLREYDQAHEFTPAATGPSHVADVHRRGRNLNVEIERDARSSSNKAPSHMTAEKPRYSSPAKTLRAADAARAELSGLSGEARHRQQNEAFQKANPAAGGSQVVNSTREGSARSKGQASSPHDGAHRAQSRNSGKDKQLATYDPEYAGKQMAGQANAGRG